MDLPAHKQGENGNAKVGENTYGNQLMIFYFCGKPSKDQSTWKCNDLCQQESQKKSCAVKTEGCSVDGCHINDRIDSVDIKKERD